MKIYIPHLHYTINVRDVKNAYELKEWRKTNHNAKMSAQDVSSNEANIYVIFPIKDLHAGSIGHEIVHVLQFISNNRGIDFVNEQEHFGYLFQFIFNKIYNRRYE
jgi:hypothetical protein